MENAQAPTSRQWFGLIAVSLGLALIVVDTTIVNVINPLIIQDLGLVSVQAQWIQESYAIILAALLLLTGRFSDLLGARRVYLAGAVVFGLTSVLAAFAPSGEILILARLLQGIGAAMILPSSLALVNATFSGRYRGQAFAIWGSTIGAAAAVGPLLGGWLGDFSWRLAFAINIPLVVLIILGVRAFLVVSPRTKGSIDVLGAILSVVGLGLIAFGLIEGRNYGWFLSTRPFDVLGFSWNGGISPVLVALVVGAAALIAFVRRQAVLSRGDGVEPLMDVRLFSIASFRNGNIATLIIGLAEFGIIAVLPLWLQFTLGYDAFQTGLALVALAVGSFCASGASFGLTAKVAALGQVRIGLVLECVGLALLGLIAATDSAWWLIALALLVYGVGVGFATAQVTNVVLADLPGRSIGQGSGIQSTFRQLGTALGIAVITTVFFSTLSSNLSALGARAGLSPADADGLARSVTESAGAVIPSLSAQPQTAALGEAARMAMTSGLAFTSYVCAGLLLLGLAATLLIPAAKAPATTAGDSPEREPSRT